MGMVAVMRAEYGAHRSLAFHVGTQRGGMYFRAFNARRNPTVQRVNDQRGARVFADAGALVPEVVVAAGTRSACRRRFGIDDHFRLGGVGFRTEFRAADASLHCLFFSEEFSRAEAFGELHGSSGIEIPDSAKQNHAFVFQGILGERTQGV